MKTKNMYLAAIMFMGAAASAFGQATICTDPTSLTFDLSTSAFQQTPMQFRLCNNAATFLTLVPNGVLLNNSATAIAISAGSTVNVRPNLSTATSAGGSITVCGGATLSCPAADTVSGGVTTKLVTVNFTGATTGTGLLSASSSSLTFNQVGGTLPGGQLLLVTNNTGVAFTPNILYENGSGWLNLVQSGNYLTITPIMSLPTGTYKAYLTLSAGSASAIVPITLYVNTAGGGTTGSFTVSPNPITFTTVPGTTFAQQTITVYTSTAATFTATPSTLSGLLQISPNPTTTVCGTSTLCSATLTATLLNSTFLTQGNIGTITFTGSGLLDTVVPVYLNTTGTGFGTITATPTLLTFNTNVGATTAPNQTIQVTSSDFSAQQISVSATSTNNFLAVTSSSTVTPATLTVAINPAVLTQAGTYSGTISVTPLTGTGAGVATTIPVTAIVTAGASITAVPSTVSITAKAGDRGRVQRNVDIRVSGTDVGYSSNATTSSGGNWLSVIPSTGSVPSQITVSADVTNLAAGTYTGTVNIVTSVGTTPITVNLTVEASGTLTLSQSALTFAARTTDTAAPPSQTVQITSSDASLSWNATATTTGGGNWLQVSPASGTTPGTLTVTANASGVAAGTYRGTVTVNASGATNSPRTIDVTLNVSAIATPVPSTVSSAASFLATGVSPGMIATVKGTDLGPVNAVQSNPTAQGTIPTTLGGVQVLFDNIPAPILYASATQINVVVPFEISGRFSTRMRVVNQDVRSNEIELAVKDAIPALFTANATGSGAGAILNQNGSVNAPNNPEARGSVVVMYATGFGLLSPAPGTGQVVQATSNLPVPLGQVRVRIGGVDAPVLYAGAAPGFVAGAIQLNVRVPNFGSDVPLPANLPVQLQVGDQTSQATVTVSVR